MRFRAAGRHRSIGLTCLLVCGLQLFAGISAAQTCGAEYTIKEGETLGQIAARVYGDPSQWTVIFYSNQDRLGSNTSLLVPGLSIRLPCIGRRSAPAQAAPPPTVTQQQSPSTPSASSEGHFLISSMVHRIEFLTADGYPPYTGRALEHGGMITNLLSSAMNLVKQDAKGQLDYGISWVNDWAAHLNPLLLTRAFDVGFPWDKPDCQNTAELPVSARFRCERFFFSNPIYEVVTVLYVRNDSRIKSLSTEEIDGTTICRPVGYSVYELDHHGRNWLKDKKIALIRPQTVEECFRLVANGTADGVAVAELVGQSTSRALGLEKQLRSLEPPVALTTLHVVVSKTHPHARTLLYYINTAMGKLRQSGEYDRIIERHLSRYWESQSTPDPTLATTPAKPAQAATPSSARVEPSAVRTSGPEPATPQPASPKKEP